MLRYFIFTILGFLSGSIMYSYVIPKLFCKIDITKISEDHNPGTANVMKYAGPQYGIICLALDILKGTVPVYIAAEQLAINNLLFSLVMIAPVFGHAFSPFLKRKGGKAIATTFGVLLGILKYTNLVFLLAILLIFFSVIITIKPHAVRVMVSIIIFAAIAIVYEPVKSFAFGSLMISAVVIYKHMRSWSHQKIHISIFVVDSYRKITKKT